MVPDNRHRSPLMPPQQLLPPRGCQGAVTGWSALLDALDDLGAEASDLATRFGSADHNRFGGPAALMATLAAAPDALTAARPPADIYGNFAWLVVRVLQTVQTIALTLPAVAAMLEDAASRSIPAAPLASEVAGELAALADGMIGVIAHLARQLAGSDDARRAALDRQQAAATALAQATANSASLDPREPFRIRAVGRAVAAAVERASADYTAANSAVAVLAVLAHLAEALAAMDTGWREWRDGLEGINAGTCGIADYWQADLQSDRAAAAWADFGRQIRAFVPGLFEIRASRHATA